MAKWMYNFCGWCPDLCMTHRALLYCGYTEFYQLSCVSKMSSWFFCTIMKGSVIPPVVESRAGFTGPYNVCNKYIPLSGSPRLPTSAWRQRWVTGWAQQFCFPYFLLPGSFQGGKGVRVSQPYSSCVVLSGSELCLPNLTSYAKLLPLLCPNNITFRKYKALLSILCYWEKFMIPIYFWSTNRRTSWVKC